MAENNQALRISVAMITYNGVRYIEEQLTSILNQTVKPDEVIISDDGSTDGSVELINRMISDYSDSGINISLLTDNPNHGISTNYEWAVRHTTGDIIFSSSQDDIWSENKIEKVLRVYCENSDAKVVITDAYLIDYKGDLLNKKFSQHFTDSINVPLHETKKVDRKRYLSYAETTTLADGPVVSYKSTLKDLILPIPFYSAEDIWIEVIGLAENGLYFLKEKTTYYRIHNSTTKTEGVSFFKKISKNLRRSKSAYEVALSSYCFGEALISYFNNSYSENFDGKTEAIDTVHEIIRVSETELNCMRKGRFCGAAKLLHIFCSDIRFRKSGFQQFIIIMLYIVLQSKKKRNHDIEEGIAKAGL